MPFKIRLKKSRQYNVVSKSLFVICVELLDSNSIECTLSAESSGRECLDSVCQRLGLQQPEFFGLRYISRHGSPHLRWVEMDRPIKKQLDRHARELNLLLRVMYYVSGVTLLQDEMTRYHYFLQLKMDVIEGRMHCDPKQSVLLASYSMQAEFGNHDQERHTTEYLKEFLNLFPKHLIEQGHLESLAEAVVCQHAALVGLPQGTAEEYYILAAQQLDGYGQETFIAKDEAAAEVIIGVSLSGIVVGYEDTQSSKFYRWKDITNVINHKRTFGIECQVAEETVQFQFPDPQSAKYVWRMCVHQHTFYMQNEQASEQNTGPVFHSALDEGQLSESREELDNHDMRGSDGGLQWSEPLARIPHTQFASCVDLTTSQDLEKLRALLPSYRPAPDYETAVQHKYMSHPGQQLLYGSQPEIHQGGHYGQRHYPDVARVEHTYSTPDLDTIGNHIQLLHLYKPPPPYPASNSTPDLACKTSPDLVSSRRGGDPGGATEPIYENVPLPPWTGTVPPGRSRASSVQSAPEMRTPPETAPPCPPTPHASPGGDKKPKRKWGLLGGGKSKSKDSKSNTLTKNKNSGDSVNSDIQHRWSVGLPRLPLSPSISKEAMCQLLERKLVDSQLFFEFEKIPKKKTNAETSMATHSDNACLNRCTDVLPYEENRVRLSPGKDNRHGYINASHVTASVGEHQRFYVAAQGPLPSTVATFWQAVWEADVYLIVMLTGIGEDASAPYYPGRTDRCVEVGEFQVWRQFSQETGHCVTTKLRLYHSGSRRIRAVWHLQYTEWGDQGCPNNVGHFLGFLEELSSVRQHSVGEIPAGHNRNPPVLVHCGTGAGRTGVAILCDLLLYTLDHNQELDIPRVVAQLRHQRMSMVQTVAQYRFVYSLLIHYLKHSRLI